MMLCLLIRVVCHIDNSNTILDFCFDPGPLSSSLQLWEHRRRFLFRCGNVQFIKLASINLGSHKGSPGSMPYIVVQDGVRYITLLALLSVT